MKRNIVLAVLVCLFTCTGILRASTVMSYDTEDSLFGVVTVTDIAPGIARLSWTGTLSNPDEDSCIVDIQFADSSYVGTNYFGSQGPGYLDFEFTGSIATAVSFDIQLQQQGGSEASVFFQQAGTFPAEWGVEPSSGGSDLENAVFEIGTLGDALRSNAVLVLAPSLALFAIVFGGRWMMRLFRGTSS